MVLGLWAGLFSVAMMLGMNEQRMNSAVDSYLSHVQVHHPSFTENFDVDHTVSDFDSLAGYLSTNNRIKCFSSRTIISAMASTAHGAAGVRIIGVNPAQEKEVSNVSQGMDKGSYFEGVKSKPAIIG